MNHPKVTEALEQLEQANLAGYFEALDEVVPSNLKATYNQLKGQFITGNAPWDFNQKLAVFAKAVGKTAVYHPPKKDNSTQAKTAIRSLIIKGNISEAIEKMLDLLDDNSIILLSSRFKANEKGNRLGTISSERYDLERNKITNSLLELLKED